VGSYLHIGVAGWGLPDLWLIDDKQNLDISISIIAFPHNTTQVVSRAHK
jgi:hypothetical protein